VAIGLASSNQGDDFQAVALAQLELAVAAREIRGAPQVAGARERLLREAQVAEYDISRIRKQRAR